jgi:4-amino-4-deoxy-L-arabinose transferase-like glycosyltransferase
LSFGIVLLVGGLFRFSALGEQSLWIDEAFTHWFASRGAADLLNTLRLDMGNLPLHFLLTNPFTESGEAALRLVPALAGFAAIPLCYLLGKSSGGPIAGFISSIFWALHPMAIWYARDAKPYALAGTLSAACLLLYLEYRKNPQVQFIVLAIPALAIGLLTHYYFFLVAMALVLAAAIEMPSSPRRFRIWTMITLIAGIPFALLLGWYLTQPDPQIGLGWISRPAIFDLLATVGNLLSGYAGELSFTALIFGLVTLIFASRAILAGTDRFLRIVAICGIALPILGVWIISLRRPIYMDRYFIVLLPWMSLLVGVGGKLLAERLSKNFSQSTVVTGLIGVFAISGLINAAGIFSDPKYRKENWRGLSDQLAQKSGRVWLSDPESVIPLTYYYDGELQYLPEKECEGLCTWVLRQPYTATHAFAQAISDPQRPWLPSKPRSCELLSQWEDGTGIELWELSCAG